MYSDIIISVLRAKLHKKIEKITPKEKNFQLSTVNSELLRNFAARK